MSIEPEYFRVLVTEWNQYLVPISSSRFMPNTDCQLEVVVERLNYQSETGKHFGFSVKREDGCLQVPITKIKLDEKAPDFDENRVNDLLEELVNHPEAPVMIPKMIQPLLEPDPFALPQRKMPDFLRISGEPHMIFCKAFVADLPLTELTVNDDMEIEVRGDVLRHPLYSQTFVRVWATWPGSSNGHLVCWMVVPDFKPGRPVGELIALIVHSEDFRRRVHLLHDRWRTSQGLPSVSTPEEMTLLPIPEGLPKPAARGVSMKRRRRR